MGTYTVGDVNRKWNLLYGEPTGAAAWFGPGGYAETLLHAVAGARGGTRGVQARFRQATPRGGTYTLHDASTDKVMRTGRTKDLERRKGEMLRDPATKDLVFKPDRTTDDYCEQRGREQIIHDLYRPPLDRINAISSRNPNRKKYLDAAERMDK
jgi:hypothetical protein